MEIIAKPAQLLKGRHQKCRDADFLRLAPLTQKKECQANTAILPIDHFSRRTKSIDLRASTLMPRKNTFDLLPIGRKSRKINGKVGEFIFPATLVRYQFLASDLKKSFGRVACDEEKPSFWRACFLGAVE